MLARTARAHDNVTAHREACLFLPAKPTQKYIWGASATTGGGNRDRRILTMKTQEPDVAFIAPIGPNKQNGVQDAFEKTLSSGPPHQQALALRALVDFFGE